MTVLEMEIDPFTLHPRWIEIVPRHKAGRTRNEGALQHRPWQRIPSQPACGHMPAPPYKVPSPRASPLPVLPLAEASLTGDKSNCEGGLSHP